MRCANLRQLPFCSNLCKINIYQVKSIYHSLKKRNHYQKSHFEAPPFTEECSYGASFTLSSLAKYLRAFELLEIRQFPWRWQACTRSQTLRRTITHHSRRKNWAAHLRHLLGSVQLVRQFSVARFALHCSSFVINLLHAGACGSHISIRSIIWGAWQQCALIFVEFVYYTDT